jgi:hypothetical protein
MRSHLLIALLTAAPAAASTGLEVEAGTPDELCPDVATTREAVRGRMGGVLVNQRQGRWLARYTTWYAPDLPGGRLLRLEIFDPAGHLEKTSDLPAGGESCGALAQLLALKIQTHFRPPEAVMPAPADGPAPHRLSLGLGLAALSDGPALGAELQARVQLGRLGLALSTVLPPRRASESLEGGGNAELRGLPLRATLVLDLLRGRRWRGGIGPEVLVVIDRAETNDIALPRYDTRVLLGLGAAALVSWQLDQAWSLQVTGSLVGMLPLATSQLAVRYPGDREVEVLRAPGALARLSVGIVYGF